MFCSQDTDGGSLAYEQIPLSIVRVFVAKNIHECHQGVRKSEPLFPCMQGMMCMLVPVGFFVLLRLKRFVHTGRISLGLWYSWDCRSVLRSHLTYRLRRYIYTTTYDYCTPHDECSRFCYIALIACLWQAWSQTVQKKYSSS